MTDNGSRYRILLRLAPSAAAVLCWYVVVRYVHVVRPYLLILVLGVFYTLMPVCPYVDRIRKGPPKDFWVALVVSALGFVYTLFDLFGTFFWSGAFAD